MRRRIERAAVPLLSVAFVPLWASGFIAGKLATQRADVLTVLLWRFVIAAVVMGAVCVFTRAALPRGRAWLHLTVTALLLQVGQFSAVYTGLAAGVPAGLSSLVLGMAPLMVGLLTPLLLAERLGAAPVLGLVLGAAGVYVVLSDEIGGAASGMFSGAVIFPVLGMLALAAGTLYQKRFGAGTAVSMTVTVQMLTSLAVTLVAMPFSGAAWLPPTLGAWAAVGWLGVFNSALAFAAMFVLLRRTGTVHVSALLNLVPATVALLAVPILGEALTGRAVLGLGIALVGMYVGLGMIGRRATGPGSPPPAPQTRPDPQATSCHPVRDLR